MSLTGEHKAGVPTAFVGLRQAPGHPPRPTWNLGVHGWHTGSSEPQQGTACHPSPSGGGDVLGTESGRTGEYEIRPQADAVTG